MGRSTIGNGIKRAVREIALPSLAVLSAVVYARTAWGEIVAGVVFLGATAVVFLGIYLSAKYWTRTYLAGFALTGLVLVFVAPDVVSDLVHPAFAYLGTALVLGFLLLMIGLLGEKVGLRKP